VFFIIVALLLVDSYRRQTYLANDLQDAKYSNSNSRSEIYARLAHAQRNSYLTAFTLVLMLVLNKFQNMITRIISLESQVSKPVSLNQSSLSKINSELQDEINRLKKENSELKKNIDALTKKEASSKKNE
jgi:hypothetical protein